MPSDSRPRPTLKRDVGLTLFTLYGAGNIIGAGIYVLVGKVAGEAGLLAPAAFVLAAVIAGLTGLSYGELGARYPVSAGEAVYLHRAFNRKWLSVAVGLLIALAGLVSAATMARGFVGYFNEFAAAPAALIIVVLVSALTLIAARGIAESARVAAVLTLVEVGGLLWVIAVASPNLGNLAEFSLADTVPLTGFAWQGVLGGAFLAFFAFIGFEDMVNIAEEVREPERTIPLGIVLAFVMSTILYVLVTVVSIVTIPPATLAASDAPLAEVYRFATGQPAAFISLIGLVAVVNGALIQIIMAARIFYGMSCNGWLPAFFSEVSPRSRVPLRATFIAGALVLVLALALPLVSLAKTTSGMVLVVFTMINLALIRIKRREPVPEGVRAIPMAVPVIGVVASLSILVIAI
jgi:APA family basic amino acid/polyamine antiporter